MGSGDMVCIANYFSKLFKPGLLKYTVSPGSRNLKNVSQNFGKAILLLAWTRTPVKAWKCWSPLHAQFFTVHTDPSWPLWIVLCVFLLGRHGRRQINLSKQAWGDRSRDCLVSCWLSLSCVGVNCSPVCGYLWASQVKKPVALREQIRETEGHGNPCLHRNCAQERWNISTYSFLFTNTGQEYDMLKFDFSPFFEDSTYCLSQTWVHCLTK